MRCLGKSRYGHSIIITGFSSNKGDLYYCGHTNDVNGGSFRKKVLEKSLLSKVRLIHITY
ncbi:hypothetical protein FDJ70_12515 [Clostridium botulinum]|uniref:Uncharacterized protein n=1 Tax=Clostridium botulinum D str. 1873 TaxID=592027 RepID=A0A9P2LM07_CLOBO|nr:MULTISPECIES: hypothetical protein [Clostridium]EES92050.1 hypothetical protein CLG_B2263 [Clostridium botulinum D str. 1873]MBO3442428.1 hypothetical protein [Clostridium haemolyticum]NFV48439.1 hypothetical protein [Clostridium botulinum]QPW56732.1 hypothetical protein IRP61_12370 [Clostridium botulinum]